MVYTIILTGAFCILFFWMVYLLIFSIASKFYVDRKAEENEISTYAILIPAYKEDEVIISSVTENLNVNFDKTRIKFFVLVDQLKVQTLNDLHSLGVSIVQIETEDSTKAKALNIGLSQIDPQEFTNTIILDADNVMHEDFMSKVNGLMHEDCQILQAHRTAKNDTGAVALLDSINEEIGNSFFRKGHRVMGLSSALIGSGMVFKTDLIKRIMPNIINTASEDKMLEFALLEEKIQVEYADEAIVYDEKVSNMHAFGTQRKRWITARLFYLRHFASVAVGKLFKGDVDYFNKWLEFLLPQKTLLLGYIFLCCLFGVLTPGFMWPTAVLMFITIAAFGLAIPKERMKKINFNTLIGLVKIIVNVAVILLKSTTADHTKFEVTQKSV